MVHASAEDENADLLWGAARRRRQLRRGDAARVPPAPTRAGRRRRARLPRRGRRATLFAASATLSQRSPRDLSCQASLDGRRVAGAGTRRSCRATTGSDGDSRELRALRSAPGLVEDGVARALLPRPAAGGRLGLRREPALLEGSLRARAAGRAARRTARPRSSRWAGRPDGILIESLHGAPKDTDAPAGVGRASVSAAFNVSAHGDLAGRGARRGASSAGHATRRPQSNRGRSAAAAT